MIAKNRQTYVNSPNLREYRLEYQGELEPRSFHARNDEDALVIARDILNIRAKAKKNFLKAGGKALFCGERRVFPPTSKEDADASH